jgi:hypothetical protein
VPPASIRHARMVASSWFDRDPERLRRERVLVETHFPYLNFEIDASTGRVAFEGSIPFTTSSGIPEPVRIRVILGDAHPKVEPTVEDIDGRFPKTPTFHKFAGTNRICLWWHEESKWTPADGALLPFLQQVLLHVERQLICEADPKHRWPGPEHRHSADAVRMVLCLDRLDSRWLARQLVHASRSANTPRLRRRQ